ncbi:hypothetical protein Tco_1353276 [Tanacetum coccineum]
MTMEILPEPTSNKLCGRCSHIRRSGAYAGNHVKKILLNLNLPDHSHYVFKMKQSKEDNPIAFKTEEKYEHVDPESPSSQDNKIYDDIKEMMFG